MELAKFRVTNFRSVNDSGDIYTGKITSLVGRNESGKSNLLLALASLNPAGGRTLLSNIKDFPRGRRLEECKPDTPVVWAWWKLTPEERSQLRAILQHEPEVKEVAVGRGYAPDPWVCLGVKHPTPDQKKVGSIIRRLGPVVMSQWAALEDPHKSNCTAAWKSLEDTSASVGNPTAWATATTAATATLRKRLGEASITLGESEDGLLLQLEEHAKLIGGFDAAAKKARDLVTGWLPTFVYVSDFPELYGHENLDSFTQRRGQDPL